MVSFGEAIKQQGRTIMCNLLGGPAAVPYLGGTPNPDINALAERINGARRYFCNESGGITPQEIADDYGGGNIPFAGGQCAGVAYTVTFRQTTSNYLTNDCQTFDSNTVDFQRTLIGPINGFREAFTGTGTCGPTVWQLFVTLNGVESLLLQYQPLPRGRREGGYSLEVLSVVRQDGQPDNCGSPPVIIPPYNPTTITINIEYEDNDNITINEDVNVTVFAPIVLIGGAIIAPITITGNDFSLVGEVALNGEFELSFSPDITLNIGGSVDEDPPPPGRPIELPEVGPSSRAIIGAIVTVTDAQGGRATQIGQGTNPDIFAPRLGNISFYVSTSRGTAWTTDVPIKNVRQYVQCPYPFGAVDVAGTPETGYAFDIQPVFDRPLLESA